jgi:hypothetical protein
LAGAGAIYWYATGVKTPAAGTIGEAAAIKLIQNKYPELKAYPSDNLPPKSIKTEKADGGWDVAFVQEGSGVPVILAKCFFVDNAGAITAAGVYSPKYSNYGIDDISLVTCRPKSPNPIPGGEVPPTSVCAVENCHGMDIKCGPNPPQVCDMMYGIGDKCLKYAQCGVQDGRCGQIQNPEFTQCKTCVQKCVDANKNEAIKAFQCESACN